LKSATTTRQSSGDGKAKEGKEPGSVKVEESAYHPNDDPNNARPPAYGNNVECISAGNASAPATSMEGGDAAEVSCMFRRTGTKPHAKKGTSGAESLQTATTKRVACAEEKDSMTEVLGPVLVVGALGRKIGDARSIAMLKGITECRVELMSTRQKAKIPLPAVPDNSVESEDLVEGVDASDVRRSVSMTDRDLSMTDQQIQLELPGDGTGESGAAGPSGGVM